MYKRNKKQRSQSSSNAIRTEKTTMTNIHEATEIQNS